MMLERFNYRKKFWNDLLDHSLVMAHLWNQREGIFALWNEFSFMFMLIKVEKDNNALITSPACIARVKKNATSHSHSHDGGIHARRRPIGLWIRKRLT